MNEIEKTYLILDLVVIILLSCFLSIFVNQNGEERYTSLMGVLTGLTYITSRLTNYKKIMNVFHFFIPITSLFIIITSDIISLEWLISTYNVLTSFSFIKFPSFNIDEPQIKLFAPLFKISLILFKLTPPST